MPMIYIHISILYNFIAESMIKYRLDHAGIFIYSLMTGMASVPSLNPTLLYKRLFFLLQQVTAYHHVYKAVLYKKYQIELKYNHYTGTGIYSDDSYGICSFL